jgi:hypothetical protein
MIGQTISSSDPSHGSQNQDVITRQSTDISNSSTELPPIPSSSGRARTTLGTEDRATGFGFQPPPPSPSNPTSPSVEGSVSVWESANPNHLTGSISLGDCAPSISLSGLSLENLRTGPIEKFQRASERHLLAVRS